MSQLCHGMFPTAPTPKYFNPSDLFIFLSFQSHTNPSKQSQWHPKIDHSIYQNARDQIFWNCTLTDAPESTFASPPILLRWRGRIELSKLIVFWTVTTKTTGRISSSTPMRMPTDRVCYSTKMGILRVMAVLCCRLISWDWIAILIRESPSQFLLNGNILSVVFW